MASPPGARGDYHAAYRRLAARIAGRAVAVGVLPAQAELWQRRAGALAWNWAIAPSRAVRSGSASLEETPGERFSVQLTYNARRSEKCHLA